MPVRAIRTIARWPVLVIAAAAFALLLLAVPARSAVAIANASAPMVAPASSPSSSAAPIQTGTISGVQRVYVSVVEATPQTSDDVNTGMTQSAVQAMINRLDSYWSTQSGGMVTVVLGGYETDSLGESSCSPNDVLGAEESDAFGGMFADEAWQGTDNHLMVLSTESCDAESFATVGGGGGGEIFSGNGISASLGVEYLLHEFGHNLGFEHADASICTNTTSYDGLAADFSFTSTVCPTREYDDYFDIMGYTVRNATPNLSSPQRIMAGWLTNYVQLTAASGAGPITETLTALGGAGGTQALEIVDPTSGDQYYVEYRTDAGLDATSAEFNYSLKCDPAMSGYTICELDSNKSTGVVRILRFIPFATADANGTTVMATALTAGSTNKTKRHTHLDAGNSFTSVDGGFTLKVTSTRPSSGATVVVSFPSAAGASRSFTAMPLHISAPTTASTAAPMTTDRTMPGQNTGLRIEDAPTPRLAVSHFERVV